jgi:hypothetical protein
MVYVKINLPLSVFPGSFFKKTQNDVLHPEHAVFFMSLKSHYFDFFQIQHMTAGCSSDSAAATGRIVDRLLSSTTAMEQLFTLPHPAFTRPVPCESCLFFLPS